MMLVDAQPVEAELLGIGELIQIFVVDEVRALGVEQLGIDIDPDRGVLVPEIGRQMRVRHQMEPQEFHRAISLCVRRSFAPYGIAVPLPRGAGCSRSGRLLPWNVAVT